MRHALFAMLAAAALSVLASTSLAQTDYLIYDPDGNANSGPVIQSTLNGIGFSGVYTTDLTPYLSSLDTYCSIWICLGVFPDAQYPWFSNPEYNDSLVSYLVNYDGKIYMEGGECWFNDPPFLLRTYFNIQSLDGGAGDLATVDGVVATFTDGMSFSYSGDNAFIDHIDPTGTAFTIFNNSSPAYGCGVAYDDGAGAYKTVGVSFEFGGLDDGASPSTKDSLARAIMGFFGCSVTQANYDLVTFEILNPGWYAQPGIPTAPVVKFKNVGLNDANNVDAYVDITGPYSSQRTISVPAGGEIVQAFDNWTPGSPCTQYTLTAYHTWNQDERPQNDTLTGNVISFDGRWHIYSAWAESTVDWTDGVITPSEWSDAVIYDVGDIQGRSGNGQSCGVAYLYVKNNADTLYMAFDGIFDSVEEDDDVFDFYLEDNYDGAWPAFPDSGEGELKLAHHPPPVGPWISYKPMMSDSSNMAYFISASAFSSFTGGHLQVEWVIPMGSAASLAHDLNANAGDTVGFWMLALEWEPFPQPSEVYAWWPTSSPVGQGALSDMGNLVLASTPNIDLTPLKVESPGDSVCQNVSTPVSAWVKNIGNVTRTFDIAFLVNDGTVYADTASVSSLIPGDSALAAFADWNVGNCTPGSWYDLTVITLDGNDINHANDTLFDSTECVICTVDVHDVGAVQILWPPDSVCVDSTYIPSAIVDNFGNRLESFWVSCDIPPLYIDSVFVANFDPTDPPQQVDFAPWVVPSNPGVDYPVCVTTLLPGDQNTSNDMVCDSTHSVNCVGVLEGMTSAGLLTFGLHQNTPNPLRTHTNINYQIARGCRVKLGVYDITGRLVATLVDAEQEPGRYSVRWSGNNNSGQVVGNGIYFYRLEAGEFRSTLKLAVVR